MDTVAAASGADPQQPLAQRLLRIGLWIGGLALLLFVLDLLGVPAGDWIRDLLRKVGDVPPWAVASGIALETAQTSLAALAWFGILRAALPQARFPGEPRHLGDAADAERHLRDGLLRPAGREDPFHDPQRGALPVPLPLGQRLLFDQARLP